MADNNPQTRDLLVFTLAAPLASFGDVAPGERRVGVGRPGRSALVGLIAAALGLKRDDPRQHSLAKSLAFAIRVDRSGSVLTDYHTTQTAPARKGRHFATRRDELQVADRGTILSQREYRMDSAFTVALMALASEPFTLTQISVALSRPRFMLSAGRKACPLGLPPSPLLATGSSLADVFAIYDAAQGCEADRASLRSSMGILPRGGVTAYDLACEEIFIEQGLAMSAHTRIETRRDDPLDRGRWQFALRQEHVMRQDLPEAST